MKKIDLLLIACMFSTLFAGIDSWGYKLNTNLVKAHYAKRHVHPKLKAIATISYKASVVVGDTVKGERVMKRNLSADVVRTYKNSLLESEIFYRGGLPLRQWITSYDQYENVDSIRGMSNKLRMNMSFTYNEKSQLTVATLYDEKGRISYTYKMEYSGDRLKSLHEYDYRGMLREKMLFLYDKKGFLSKKELYAYSLSKTNHLLFKDTYKYTNNDLGDVIKKVNYRNDSLDSHMEITYNKNRDVVTSIFTPVNPKAGKKSIKEYTYTYNENGNITKAVTSNNGIVTHIAEHKITYYEE